MTPHGGSGTASVDLFFRPRRWQLHAWSALRRFSVLVVHRRAGKTVLALLTLVDAALKCRKPAGRYGYVAPQLKQAKATAWSILKDFTSRVPGTVVSEGELHVTFPNGAQIRVYGADNPDSLRGLYFDGVVLDEVAQMKPSVWGEVIRPALADRRGWALFIGTPKGINMFSELYYQAMDLEDWYAGLWTVNETQTLTAEELESAKEAMTETQFRQEFFCDFNASSDNQLITIDEVLTAIDRVPNMQVVEAATPIVGVDVARYGDDRTVISCRQGPMLWPLVYMRKSSNVEVAQEVARVMQRRRARMACVDAGRGEGVTDLLRTWGYRVHEVQFGGKAKPGYRRKRDEILHATATWVRTVGCLPDDPELRQALCTPTYSYDNVADVLDVESKDSIKDRGLPSPDPLDSVACTLAFPVANDIHPAHEQFRARPGQGRRGPVTVFDDHGAVTGESRLRGLHGRASHGGPGPQMPPDLRL